MAARTRPETFAFPWARSYDADQLAAFIEDLWGAASGDNDLATLDAIEKVIAEHRPDPAPCPLTAREIEVLTEVANGEMYESAAEHLGLSVPTVRSHCATIYDRLGARRGAQATAIAAHHGWLPGLHTPDPVAPIPKRGPHAWKALYRERAAEMCQRPGEVVEVGPYGSRNGALSSAARISKGLMDIFRPAGSFEAEAVPINYTRWFVRARYIGMPGGTEQKAAS